MVVEEGEVIDMDSEVILSSDALNVETGEVKAFDQPVVEGSIPMDVVTEEVVVGQVEEVATKRIRLVSRHTVTYNTHTQHAKPK